MGIIMVELPRKRRRYAVIVGGIPSSESLVLSKNRRCLSYPPATDFNIDKGTYTPPYLWFPSMHTPTLPPTGHYPLDKLYFVQILGFLNMR
jgi:hypothetical protein